MAKSFWSEKDQRLVSIKQSNPITEHDGPPLPGGKKIADVDSTELARLLASYGISGERGHHADTAQCPLMTQSGHSRRSR